MSDRQLCALPVELAGLVPMLAGTCLVVMMGASGAGKSTLAARIAAACGGETTSYDGIREELTGDPYAAHATIRAVELCQTRTGYRLDQGLSTVIDATHTRREYRLPWVELAAGYGVPAALVGVLTPDDVCVARQLGRAPYVPGTALGRRVPEDVVRRQHTEMTASLTGLDREGWTGGVYLIHDNTTEEKR